MNDMQRVAVGLDPTEKRRRHEYQAWAARQNVEGCVMHDTKGSWNSANNSEWTCGRLDQVPPELTQEYAHFQTLPYPGISTTKDELLCSLNAQSTSTPQRSPLPSSLSPADQVLQIFLVHALQNPWGRGWRINWQQFKGLTKYAMLPSSSGGSSLAWDTQKMLAFKGHATCSLGLTYPECLLALAHLFTTTASGTESTLDLPSLHSIVLEATASSTSSLRNTFQRLEFLDSFATTSATTTLVPFSKSLHALMAAFRAPGAPPNRLSFAEFRAFVAAVRLKTTTHVTSQQLAAIFVHEFRADMVHDAGERIKPFHHVHVPIHRLMRGLVHVGMCGVPRFLGLAPHVDAALHDHVVQHHALGHEYAATCTKIVLQAITQALQPVDIDVICCRLPASSAHSFRQAAASLHRTFVTLFQADGGIDYVARCRELVTTTTPLRRRQQPPPSMPPPSPFGASTPDLDVHPIVPHQPRAPQHPLDGADDLLDAIVVEVTDMHGQVDIEFIATQWAAAVDTYERFVATEISSGDDHRPFLLRYATTLTAFAQQLWVHRDAADILELAVEAVRIGSVTFHAYWASLCIATHDHKRASVRDLTILTCVLQWARCLHLHGDFASHQTRHAPDTRLDFSPGLSSPTTPVGHASTTHTIELWSIDPTASAAEFYNAAWRRYVIAIAIHPTDANVVNCVVAQVQLALHLPSGCAAAKDVFHDALDRLASLEIATDDSRALERHIRAVLFVRHEFLGPSTPFKITPFYAYVVAVVFTRVSTTRRGLSPSDLNRVNAQCALPPVAQSTIEWLQATFECTAEGHLTQAGLAQYLIHLATTDPTEFDVAFRALTRDLDDALPRAPSQCFSAIRQHQVRPPPAAVRQPRPTTTFHRRRPLSRFPPLDHSTDAIADCFVVLSGVVLPMTQSQLDASTAATDVRVVVQVTDTLYHPTVTSFCVPDAIATFLYPAPTTVLTAAPPPRWFDTVLTDINGTPVYASTLQFAHPTAACALHSLVVADLRGGDATVAPSWLDTGTTYFVPKCLCFLSRRPAYKTLHHALRQVYRSQHLESKVIAAFLQVPMPTSSAAKTVCTIHSHTFLVHHPQPFSPHDVDFALVFQRLSLDHIVEVLALVVCEKKVAVAATCVAMLTPVLETLRALVHPYFVSQVVYIPVVPEHLSDFLCSPVPFVVGVSAHQLQQAQRDTLDDVIFVNLDTNTISAPPQCPLPRVPDRPKKKLVKALGALCERAAIAVRDETRHVDDTDRLYGLVEDCPVATDDVAWRHEQCDVAAHMDDVWSGLQELVTGFFRSLVRDCKKYCRASPAHQIQFDSKGYLRDFGSTREFCSHFFETQQFQQYIAREMEPGHAPPIHRQLIHQRAGDAMGRIARQPTTGTSRSRQPRDAIHFVVANITD
ncbi:hypothetical protein, variant [Aphanomyces invadans]|uniref:UDENN domain-containing protein n=1 Tax=Aphanomyces invadans TaxID=157072 RepID=A0A024TWE6_9STRA|nr:hypothetical protein, variant [Aphanomyces invadans]ETV98465.1 hypothetical protein, variant [Aphanomyces invadans]|eukprot:XP_008872662.1 hypothetical protein, variant [Aphanomyces invadans]